MRSARTQVLGEPYPGLCWNLTRETVARVKDLGTLTSSSFPKMNVYVLGDERSRGVACHFCCGPPRPSNQMRLWSLLVLGEKHTSPLLFYDAASGIC